MIKTVEVIVIIALLIFSFFLGVKYSESVKSHMSWLETQDEQEVELPDLSNETSEIGNAPVDMVDPNSAPILDNVDPNSPNQIAPAEVQIENQIENQPQPVAPVAPQAPVVPVQR